MKSLLRTIVTAVTTFSPALVFAHVGHSQNESVHSLLHTEHIVLLIAAVIITFAIVSRSK